MSAGLRRPTLAGFPWNDWSDGRGTMAETRGIRVRVPESLEARARARSPELAALDMSTLVRVGLAVLAGHDDLREAVSLVRARPGRKPRREAAA